MTMTEWIRSLPVTSLRELKDAITEVEAARAAGNDSLTFDEEEFVKIGRPIDAVRSYRNRLHCDLRTAVIAIRKFQAALPSDHPMYRDPSTVGV